jgi:hypothetical protein
MGQLILLTCIQTKGLPRAFLFSGFSTVSYFSILNRFALFLRFPCYLWPDPCSWRLDLWRGRLLSTVERLLADSSCCFNGGRGWALGCVRTGAGGNASAAALRRFPSSVPACRPWPVVTVSVVPAAGALQHRLVGTISGQIWERPCSGVGQGA